MKVCSIVDLLLGNPRVCELGRDLVFLRQEMHLRLLGCLSAERHLYRSGGLLFALMRVEGMHHSTSPLATDVLNC
jgi:hypothetical protein